MVGASTGLATGGTQTGVLHPASQGCTGWPSFLVGWSTGKIRVPSPENPTTVAAMTHEDRLARLNLPLPSAPAPVAVYRSVVVAQGLAYVSGHGPLCADGSWVEGRVGADLTLEQGHAAARQTGLAILATLRAHLGSLNQVKRVVKLLGMVNATPEFQDHPKVINGCSELFAAVFGEADGIGARSAVGMGSLPGNIAVEIEGIFELA